MKPAIYPNSVVTEPPSSNNMRIPISRMSVGEGGANEPECGCFCFGRGVSIYRGPDVGCGFFVTNREINPQGTVSSVSRGLDIVEQRQVKINHHINVEVDLPTRDNKVASTQTSTSAEACVSSEAEIASSHSTNTSSVAVSLWDTEETSSANTSLQLPRNLGLELKVHEMVGNGTPVLWYIRHHPVTKQPVRSAASLSPHIAMGALDAQRNHIAAKHQPQSKPTGVNRRTTGSPKPSRKHSHKNTSSRK